MSETRIAPISQMFTKRKKKEAKKKEKLHATMTMLHVQRTGL